MTKYNFCSYFDKNYLFRGLALYRSLARHCPDFTLWVLCMDETTYDILKKMSLKNLQLIKLADFEDEQLLAAKNSRSVVEYYWTCTPSLPLFILKKHPELKNVAYLDADLYFFASPQAVYEEMGNGSVMIIPHRYSSDLEHLEKESGIYNVGMLIFKNDENGLNALKWWREKCLAWCYARFDNGRYGDQMYLNDWPSRFPGVHVLKHKGANLAPWNIARYNIEVRDEKIFVCEDPLIFYHFHHLTIFSETKYRTHKSLYQIVPKKIRAIYPPYVNELKNVIKNVRNFYPGFAYGLSKQPAGGERIKKMLVEIHLELKKIIPGYSKIYKLFKK